MPCRQRSNRNRRSVFKIEAFGFRRDYVRFGNRVLGVTARADVTVNRIALFENLDITADLFDCPGDFAAENDRKFHPEHFSEAIADFPVNRIDRREVNFHQNLARFRRGALDIGVIQNAFITVFVNLNYFHFFSHVQADALTEQVSSGVSGSTDRRTTLH